MLLVRTFDNKSFSLMKSCFATLLCLIVLSGSAAIAGQDSAAQRSVEKGLRLYAQGDLDGAITAYRQAIAEYPKFMLAYTNLGLALMDKGDYPSAATAYEQAILLMEAPPPPG